MPAGILRDSEDTNTSRRLGKSGLKISKVILGCMTFGSSKWESSPWVLDEEQSLQLIKTAYDHGINTWVRDYCDVQVLAVNLT